MYRMPLVMSQCTVLPLSSDNIFIQSDMSHSRLQTATLAVFSHRKSNRVPVFVDSRKHRANNNYTFRTMNLNHTAPFKYAYCIKHILHIHMNLGVMWTFNCSSNRCDPHNQ